MWVGGQTGSMTRTPKNFWSYQETKPKNAQDEEGAEINAKSTEYLVNEIVAKSSTTRGIQNPK